MKSETRIAFVVDALPVVGGAEKTLFAALECFPAADVFALIYNRQAFRNTPLAERSVGTSYLDKLPAVRRYYRLLLPLMPRAIERFDLADHDVVVSFNYAVANGAQAGSAAHLSYTHTPMRYAWGDLNIGGSRAGNTALVDRYFRSFRNWDRAAAAGIREFATISSAAAGLIRTAYQRQARVIYPPVEVERFAPRERRDSFYVVVSRLVPHKRVDAIVEAFSALGLPLKIVGDGPERQPLMSRAAGNIEFLGHQSDARVAELLSRARGFVCAAEEEFGIAIVEAQAAGCPVIAYGRGGATETVVDGCTGMFFSRQSADCVIDAVRLFERVRPSFDARAIAEHAGQFDKANFKRDFERFVKENSSQA